MEQEEQIILPFTPEELAVINQVLGFVEGSKTVDNILDKVGVYVDKECLEELFKKVKLSVDNDLPLFAEEIPMQESYLTLRIGKTTGDSGGVYGTI